MKEEAVMKGKKKAEIRMPDDIRRTWDEVRLCATLIRQGQARIVSVVRMDGSRYRYTKLK